jgi:hypothetical protein
VAADAARRAAAVRADALAASASSTSAVHASAPRLPGERPPSRLALAAGVGVGPALDPRLGSVLGATLAPERQEAVQSTSTPTHNNNKNEFTLWAQYNESTGLDACVRRACTSACQGLTSHLNYGHC